MAVCCLLCKKPQALGGMAQGLWDLGKLRGRWSAPQGLHLALLASSRPAVFWVGTDVFQLVVVEGGASAVIGSWSSRSGSGVGVGGLRPVHQDK